jgi:hypothetical protein
MAHQHVPETISPSVLELCSKINPNVQPKFIAITPEPGCAVADCFLNVKRKIDHGGGRIQFGWAIWEWPHVFIEAEHHAVYEPPDGSPARDITPCAKSNHRRLFLPDDAATYDYVHEGFRRDNVRLALSDDPLINELFLAARRRSEYYNGLPGVGQIVIHASENKTLEKLERRVERAIAALEKKYGGVGAGSSPIQPN